MDSDILLGIIKFSRLFSRAKGMESNRVVILTS